MDQEYQPANAQDTYRQTTPSRHSTYREPAQDASWNWNRRPSQSPRQRQRPRARRQQGHGGGQPSMGQKGKGKGPGNFSQGGGKAFTQQPPAQYAHRMGQEGMAPLPPPPLPPLPGCGEIPWAHLAPPFPVPQAPSVENHAPTEAEIKLKKVMGVLKKNETELPPEVSEVVKDTKLTEGLCQIKNMHDAVENLGEAQQSFEKACFVRAQNLASWRQFLHLSVQRWQEYTQHFLAQEKFNLEQIATAREAVKNAQAIFKNLQEKGVITIDAEEDPALMEEEPSSTESSKRIQEGLMHMTSSLEQLANQADKEHAEEEQMKKRARKEPPDNPDAVPPATAPPSSAFGSAALTPFGKAHSG